MKIKKILSAFLLGVFSAVLFLDVAFGQARPPLEVKSVEASSGDKEVSLQWEASTDEDGVVVGYKIYYGTTSVKTGNDSYEEQVSVSTRTKYTIRNLQNGKEYFFSVTAIDDEENESETYSKEVSAVPEAKSAAVISAVQVSNTEILVVMSKPVILQGGTGSFYFEEKDTGREIPINDISVENDKVRIVFANDALDFGKNYKIMATSLVEDLAGTPIRSGITDSAELKALFFEEPSTLSEPDQAPPTETVPHVEPIKEVVVPEPIAYSSAPANMAAPLDASLLKVDSSLLESEQMVTLSWQPAPDLDNNIADQVLYLREGMKSWDDGISIGKYTSKIEIDVELNQNYQVKIITLNTSETESKGAELSFTTNLADTGTSSHMTTLALVFAMGMGSLFFFTRSAI